MNAVPASTERIDPNGEVAGLLRLAMVDGVGPRTQQALLERFGDVAGVLAAPQDQLRSVPGVGPKLATRLAAAGKQDIEVELERCRKHNVWLLPRSAEQYPRLLREIPDPPLVLYGRGESKPDDALAVAVVGCRRCTQYGRQQAERLAGALARAGLTVVSGLARGIDAAAHRGALAAGGRTIALQACGLAQVYPPEHQQLANEIAAQGAILSELPMPLPPRSGQFPQRNRLISGMSLGVLVVEATLRSGALITARLAMEQGREVFALPGRVDSPASQGCNRLIADGAKLVQSVDDILEELGPLVEPTAGPDEKPVHHPAELQLNDRERRLLDLLGAEPISTDELISTSDLPPAQVLSTLTVLEMRRLIDRLASNVYVRR